ncbi:MAG TPA: ABC transporter permease subunit, partial [Acidimicrobiia bacterium]
MLRSVFGKTIWDRRLSILWWGLGTAAMSAVLVAFYPTLRDNPAIEEFLGQIPEEFLAAFGIDPALYSTGYGFLQGQLYSFMAPVIVIALAIGLGASATAGEEEAGTMDQLLSLPIARGRLVAEKLLAMAVLLVVVLLALAAVLVGGNALVGLGLSPRGILGINVGLLLLGLFFGTFAAAVGVWRGRTAVAQ